MWPFSRSPKQFTPQDDCVWCSYNALQHGAAKQAAEAMSLGKVLIVPHYRNSVINAEVSLLDACEEAQMVTGTADASAMKSFLQQLNRRAGLVQSNQLKLALARTDLPARPKDRSRPPLAIIAWERHPLRVYDDRITVFAEELDEWFACTLTFHAALDTPPMSMFAGDTTQAILQRLGMKETDSIQHPMLSKSIAKAQAKVAEKTPQDPSPEADSAEEWFEAWKRSYEV